MWLLSIWIILILATIVVIVHLLTSLLRLVLSTLAVNEVLTLGLSKSINFQTSKTSEKLLGKGVVYSLAFSTLLILK